MRNAPKAILLIFALLAPAMLARLKGAIPGGEVAHPQSPEGRLVQLKVVGSKRYSETEEAQVTGLKIGDEVTKESFQAAANRLASTGAFSNVRYKYYPSSTGMALEFEVEDTSNFVPCKFDNFVWFSPEEIQKQLRQRVPLYQGQIPPAGKMGDEVTAALQSMLDERGVHGTVALSPVGALGGPVTGFVFQVQGVTLNISQVDFQAASRQQIPELAKTVTPLLGTNYSSGFVLDFARLNLGPVYLRQGYLRVGFDSPLCALDKDGGPGDSVTVSIPIREGLQYRLQEIDWSGNSVFTDDELGTKIHLKAGEPANGVQLEKDLNSIQDLYGTRGYIMAFIRPVPDYQDESKTVAFHLKVTEGDMYRMGKFEVVGASDSVADELGKLFRPRAGEPFDAQFEKPFFEVMQQHLSGTILGGHFSFRIVPHREDKTVDVILTFGRSSNP